MTSFRFPALALLAAGAAVLGLRAVPALAHGTMTTPHSRVYACAQGNIENPSDPACRAATAISGTQTFYNWMGINQANANGNHRGVVPDGTLCSGNNPTFSGLDLARSDWQATPIAPDANGRFLFKFRGTAPHATRDWVFYVTRDSWDPNRPLAWGDLEEFCRLGNTPLSADGTYHLSCPLPKKSGRHVIYNTWQRSDSTEAFYTCMDVKFDGTTPPPPSWRDVGALSAQNDLPQATIVRLRVLNADGSEAERVETALASGQTAAATWPGVVARNVNARALYGRIGVLANGSVTPVDAAVGNRIYLTGSGRTHAVDIQVPDAPPPTWRDVGALTAQNALPVGTVVTLRVFNANGTDAERIETALADGQTSVTAWPLRVAQNVNARSTTARIGVLSNGTIAPVASATANRIFLTGTGRTHQVDIRLPDAPPPGDYDYVYPNGIGQYIPGQTVVKGSDGKLYACRPFPNGQWCNINHPAYAPGTGWAWGDAWVLFQAP
jgi:chitin-binding protein